MRAGCRFLAAVLWHRWLLLALIASLFYWAALNNDLYNLTSPPQLDFHVLLRKAYSIVAFGIIGAVYVWASGASIARSAVVIAAYSGAIEIGQHITSGTESLIWNGIDVLCGAVGGLLGALIPWVRAR